MDYIRDHWRGTQTLLRSFWINLFALRIVILFFERFSHPPLLQKSTMAIVLTVIYFVLFQMVVFGWQARGLIRACDRYRSAIGSSITVLAAQLGLVISLIITGVYEFGAFQSLFADPRRMEINKRTKIPSSIADYTLVLGDDGKRIYLSGGFRIGITSTLTALLDQHPGVTGIVLSSDGGRVAEGRGLARLFGSRKLDTYVFETCKSACTTAFIGGASRYLGVNGKLGFHQFSMAGSVYQPYLDPQEEQRAELEFYAAQKIDRGFLDKVFQASPRDIWFPGERELLAAGVVHHIGIVDENL